MAESDTSEQPRVRSPAYGDSLAISIAPYATMAAATFVSVACMALMAYVTYVGITVVNNLPVVTQVGEIASG